MNVVLIVVSFSNSVELNQKMFFWFFSLCWMFVVIYVYCYFSGLVFGVIVYWYLFYWNSFFGYFG